jgi:acetyl esterase/lipase
VNIVVMADRAGVRRASPSVTVVALVGLSEQLANAMVKVQFRRPWTGPANPVRNVGVAVTREVLRSFLGYTSSLPIDEFRSIEAVLDQVSSVVLSPIVKAVGVVRTHDQVGSVAGDWYRPAEAPKGTILYFHGGGYVGTSPAMYGAFVAGLVRATGCEVFVADYRLAPEFPYPAALIDATAVMEGAVNDGHDPSRLFVAGDSSGGGLASALMCVRGMRSLDRIAGLILVSPEIDLRLDKPSMTENAALDILPWNVPTTSYLQGADPGEGCVSAISQNVDHWPPTMVVSGTDEMFRDSIRLLVERLRSASIETTATEAAGMFHVFPIVMPWHPAARDAMESIGAFTRDHLEAAARERL